MAEAVMLGDLDSRLVVIALMRLDFPTRQPARLTPERGEGGSESALPIPSMMLLIISLSPMVVSMLLSMLLSMFLSTVVSLEVLGRLLVAPSMMKKMMTKRREVTRYL